MGAQDRTLAKYGALLTTLGVSHLRTIMPAEHVIWPFDGGESAACDARLALLALTLLYCAGRVRTAKLLLDTLLDTGLAERKLVLWAFSNGGTFVYAMLAQVHAEVRCKVVLTVVC